MTNSEYPENREWKQKAFAMPKLPSGNMGQDKVLYYILKMVKTVNQQIQCLILKEVTVQLR